MGRASYCSRKLLVNASDHAWLNPKIFAHDAIKFACGDFELTLSENRRPDPGFGFHSGLVALTALPPLAYSIK
jgi:hypothetical protein